MKSVYKIEKEIRREGVNREQLMRRFVHISFIREPLALLSKFGKDSGIRLGLTGAGDVVRGYRYDIKRTRANEVYRVVRRLYGLNFEATYTTNGEGSAGSRKYAVDYIRDSIKTYRRRMRSNDDALVNRSPNWILKRFNENILKHNKTPKTDDAYVGIEIECIMPKDADIKQLLPFGKYISVVGDGSIEPDDGEEGREIRVCVKKSEVRDVIPGLVAKLVEMGGRVNRSCGLHVHLDQRNTNEPEKTFHKLVRALPLLCTIVPASRRENTYCKRNRHGNFQTAVNGNRYRAINASAYYKHRTIEVRLFGGTLEAKKIINWIETLHAITEGEMLNRCPKNFDTARNYWKLTDENAEWLKARQAKYGAALADTVEAQSDVVEVPFELAQNLELSEAA